MAVQYGKQSGSSNKPDVKDIAYGWGVDGYIALLPKAKTHNQ